jgi:hypothetical protein
MERVPYFYSISRDANPIKRPDFNAVLYKAYYYRNMILWFFLLKCGIVVLVMASTSSACDSGRQTPLNLGSEADFQPTIELLR